MHVSEKFCKIFWELNRAFEWFEHHFVVSDRGGETQVDWGRCIAEFDAGWIYELLAKVACGDHGVMRPSWV
jgi:hypothetical protein